MFGKKSSEDKSNPSQHNMETSSTSTTTTSTTTTSTTPSTTSGEPPSSKCERQLGEGSQADGEECISNEQQQQQKEQQQQQQQKEQQQKEQKQQTNRPRKNNSNNNNNNNSNSNNHNEKNPTAEAVYDFYRNEIFPAILASLPILMSRLAQDSKEWLLLTSKKVLEFLLPAWAQYAHPPTTSSWNPAVLAQLWEQTLQNTTSPHSAVADFMLNHFDTNGDGTISPSELINMTEIFARLQRHPQTTLSFWAWFSREWPLMDWKIGLFLWRSFGGLLFVIALLSVMPGRLHSISGKILRWPILALTYFLIIVELVVYVVIRLAIRMAELLFATPKHRALRRKMANAESYEDWYKHAAALDISQKRDKWQRSVNDHTSYRYNWALIRQLREDMQHARDNKDSLLALAVLQQCTRKNVGGVMSEDLFSYTNTGEPKYIVKEFIQEVVNTLHWITDEANKTSEVTVGSETDAKLSYEKRFERKVRVEKVKVWKSLLSWATLSFNEPGAAAAAAEGKTDEATTPKANRVQRNKTLSRTRSGSSQENNFALSSAESHESDNAMPRVLPRFHKEQLITFLKRARAAYGRTALCLSGGAMMGLYHFGHLRGLMETDCLPNIISGTSAGSIIGALLSTRTNEELRRDMTPEVLGVRMNCFERPWSERLKSLWKNGQLFSSQEWLEKIKW
jgi:hypothetical protein